MAGWLSTHVLDTARGQPAAGMRIDLWRLAEDGAGRELLTTAVTNRDGRTDAPLVAEGGLRRGRYELVFFVGDYFRPHEQAAGSPAFLEQVPVRFGVADPEAHYHVPLLTSPWAYSTYRGS
jgi:5-hydroxyisourate hydrolase